MCVDTCDTWELWAVRWFSHPEEGVQWPVFHKLSDDPLRRAASDHTLQLQHVRVVKLAQDPGFTEEHPPLPVGRPPAQSLHCHKHLPATHRPVTTSGNLTKLSWSWGEEEQITSQLSRDDGKI